MCNFSHSVQFFTFWMSPTGLWGNGGGTLRLSTPAIQQGLGKDMTKVYHIMNNVTKTNSFYMFTNIRTGGGEGIRYMSEVT